MGVIWKYSAFLNLRMNMQDNNIWNYLLKYGLVEVNLHDWLYLTQRDISKNSLLPFCERQSFGQCRSVLRLFCCENFFFSFKGCVSGSCTSGGNANNRVCVFAVCLWSKEVMFAFCIGSVLRLMICLSSPFRLYRRLDWRRSILK